MEALSAIGSHERYPYSPLDHPSVSDTVSYPSPKRSRSSAMLPPASPSMSLPSVSLSTSSNNTNHNTNTKINFLLNPSSQCISPSIASASIHTPDQKNTSLPSRPALSRSSVSSIDYRADDNAETDFEIAFLLRHYSEGPGLWYGIIPRLRREPSQ